MIGNDWKANSLQWGFSIFHYYRFRTSLLPHFGDIFIHIVKSQLVFSQQFHILLLLVFFFKFSIYSHIHNEINCMCILWVCRLASKRLVDLQMARSTQPRTLDNHFVFFFSVTLDASKKQIQLKHQNRRPPGREGANTVADMRLFVFVIHLDRGLAFHPHVLRIWDITKESGDTSGLYCSFQTL